MEQKASGHEVHIELQSLSAKIDDLSRDLNRRMQPLA